MGESEEPVVELAAVGDILLDRGIARRIERDGLGVVFRDVKDILSGADISFGNLESPVTSACDRARQRISFRANPLYADSLKEAGLDILSLANNHSMDCGRRGLLETMRHLRRKGLSFCGAGASRKEAEAPLILNIKGIRIAFVAFTAIAPALIAEAEETAPGVALASREAIVRAVGLARVEADVVIVSLHWGEEYASRPGPEQRELARLIAEAGADLILGHHTHTLEGLELIERRDAAGGVRHSLAAYSLGNFVFDSPRIMGKRVNESAILRCRLGRRGLISAELLPVVLQNYLPRRASTAEAEAILARLSTLSAELNTRMSQGRIIIKE